MGLFRTLRRSVTLVSLGVAGGALVVTARHLLETPQPLQSALPGEGRIDRKHGGDIYYNVAGPSDGEPLVLLHDFYPGASNFEYRRIFPRLAERYRVYAPDWLGFGMSEHPNVAYTGEFYAGVLTGFLRDVVQRPAIVVAHGHAANIAVRTASDSPALFERLVLVAPAVFAGMQQDPTLAQTVVRTTQRMALGLVPYALLATKPALRWISSSQSAQSTQTDTSEERVEHLYASAHQFGSQHALLALLTGELDLPMQNAFALLEPPVLIVGGEADRRHPRLDMEDVAVLNPHADLKEIPFAGAAVFEDQPDAFVSTLANWLSTPVERHVVDESALLQPNEPGEVSQPQSRAEAVNQPITSTAASAAAPSTRETDASAASAVESRVEYVSGAEAQKPSMPTEGDEPPEAARTDAGEMPGDAGYVVPGVSDMGLEGLSTPDVGGITSLEPEVTLGPEPAPQPTSSAADSESPTALLPEAGDVEAGDAAERAGNAAERDARKGEKPPLRPAANIGHPKTAEPTDAELAGAGDVAGLAHIVQTPESAVTTADSGVETASEAVETTQSEVRTPAETVDTPEMMTTGKDTAAAARSTPQAGRRAQRATSSAAREPSPKTAPGRQTRSGSGTGGASGQKRGRTGGSQAGGGHRRSSSKNSK